MKNGDYVHRSHFLKRTLQLSQRPYRDISAGKVSRHKGLYIERYTFSTALLLIMQARHRGPARNDRFPLFYTED